MDNTPHRDFDEIIADYIHSMQHGTGSGHHMAGRAMLFRLGRPPYNWEPAKIRRLANLHKLSFISNIEEKASKGMVSMLVGDINMLVSLGINWPEIDNIIDDNKPTILKKLLSIAKQSLADAKPMLAMLQSIGVDWPELAIIQRSINADANNTQVNETVPDNTPSGIIASGHLTYLLDLIKKGEFYRISLYLRTSYGYNGADVRPLIIDALNAQHKNIIKYASEMAFGGKITRFGTIIATLKKMNMDWPDIDQTIEKYKSTIIKKLLMSFKSDNFSYVLEGIKELHNAGIVWPELSTIKNSADIANDEYNDAHPNDEEDQNLDEATAEKDRTRMINYFKQNIEAGQYKYAFQTLHHMLDKEHLNNLDFSQLLATHKEPILAILAKLDWDSFYNPRDFTGPELAIALGKVGIAWPEIAEMFDAHKQTLLKLILKEYKQFQPHYTAERIDNLNNVGVAWPELAAIKRSISGTRAELRTQRGRTDAI